MKQVICYCGSGDVCKCTAAPDTVENLEIEDGNESVTTTKQVIFDMIGHGITEGIKRERGIQNIKLEKTTELLVAARISNTLILESLKENETSGAQVIKTWARGCDEALAQMAEVLA